MHKYCQSTSHPLYALFKDVQPDAIVLRPFLHIGKVAKGGRQVGSNLWSSAQELLEGLSTITARPALWIPREDFLEDVLLVTIFL